MSQRKLIRPKLSGVQGKRYQKKRQPQGRSTSSQGRKPTPPEQTFAEVYYYLKQMHSKHPVVVVLKDGEELHGWIEWYDKNVIKLNREKEPNLLLYKDTIKYIYKEEAATQDDESAAEDPETKEEKD